MNETNNIPVQAPLHRRPGVFVRILKWLIKTQIGKHIAFTMDLKGFDRVGYRHLRFVRKHNGEALKRGEILINHPIYAENADADDKPISFEKWVYKKLGGFRFSYNARVDKGAALQASLMAGSALGGITGQAAPLYIALSTSTLTPAKGDTTLTGETVVAGIARALGAAQNYVAPSVVDGAASYDIYKQFTLTGANTTVVSSALFDAASTGNMFAEANLSTSAPMVTNDILQVTWTVNI